MLLLCTTEDREVSSVDSMFSDKLFMYIRKKSGPRIDPCGIICWAGKICCLAKKKLEQDLFLPKKAGK